MLVLTIMGGIAEFERKLIRGGTEEGIERAMRRGKKFAGAARRRSEAGYCRPSWQGATMPELAEEYGVGVGTIWRALNPFEASLSV